MKLVLATGNEDKIKEIKNSLKDIENLEILTKHDLKFFPDVNEDQLTLQGNSLKKAKEIYNVTKIMTLADDTGLEVKILNNRPGVFSARYAGEKASYHDNNIKLLKELSSFSSLEKRQACFRTVMTIYGENNFYHQVEGIINGYIAPLDPTQIKRGFGYDPIFIPLDSNKTLDKYSLKEKNEISHRGQALKLIKKSLIDILLLDN